MVKRTYNRSSRNTGARGQRRNTPFVPYTPDAQEPGAIPPLDQLAQLDEQPVLSVRAPRQQAAPGRPVAGLRGGTQEPSATNWSQVPIGDTLIIRPPEAAESDNSTYASIDVPLGGTRTPNPREPNAHPVVPLPSGNPEAARGNVMWWMHFWPHPQPPPRRNMPRRSNPQGRESPPIRDVSLEAHNWAAQTHGFAGLARDFNEAYHRTYDNTHTEVSWPPLERAQQRDRAYRQRTDTNGDGRVSPEEFDRGRNETSRARPARPSTAPVRRRSAPGLKNPYKYEVSPYVMRVRPNGEIISSGATRPNPLTTPNIDDMLERQGLRWEEEDREAEQRRLEQLRNRR